jgi:hypothetical protein
MLAWTFDNHNSRTFRSPLGLAGGLPGVNKNSAGRVSRLSRLSPGKRPPRRFVNGESLSSKKGSFHGKLAHTDWQECKFTLLGIGLKKIPLKFSSRPCRASADDVNQPGGRIRACRQAPAKMFSSRVACREIKPRPRQNFRLYHHRQT